MSLTGKAVLITGANGGLGVAVTNAFLGEGAKVAGVSRAISADEFKNRNFTAISADIGTLEKTRALIAEAEQKQGPTDVLVHLAGGFAGGKGIHETDPDVLSKMMDINFVLAFNMLAAVLPGMRARRSGAVLMIGSRAAVEPPATLGAYSASKAALISLVKTAAAENKDLGITANVILPGTMDTPANRAAMPQADPAKWVATAAVGALLVSLAANRSISGAVIPIYGGEL